MKKISSKSFDEQIEVRSSDSFKDVSFDCVRISNKLQLLQFEQVSLATLLKYFNLALADKLGYADSDDYSAFYREILDTDGLVDCLAFYADSDDCVASDSVALHDILNCSSIYKLHDEEDD